ncbi:hypothetical protein [Salinigranum sp. GCM10025319]|uniref:hypothetical protein n=1 Tax=Salinigranum sp. GCM10025319 TaxID=3252687 RepID=UPI0036118CD3
MVDEPNYLDLLDRVHRAETAIVLVPSHLRETLPSAERKREAYREELPNYAAGHVPYDEFERQDLRQLIEAGLVERHRPESSEGVPVELPPILEAVRLTERGFNVAHERALQQRQLDVTERQSEANRTVALFTVVLAASALSAGDGRRADVLGSRSVGVDGHPRAGRTRVAAYSYALGTHHVDVAGRRPAEKRPLDAATL